MLEKGFSYNLKPKDTQETREYLGVECELALTNAADKYQVAKTIQNPSLELPPQHDKSAVAKRIKDKAEANNIIFTRAEKGKSIVAISSDQYINKTISFLQAGNFKQINFDPTETFQKLIKITIKELSIFNDFEKKSLILMNPQIPKL